MILLSEGLRSLTDAEARAEAIRADAAAKARWMMSEAAKRGEELAAEIALRAEAMAADIREKAARESERDVNLSKRRAKNECDRLRLKASNRMIRAVDFIVEKVVSG